LIFFFVEFTDLFTASLIACQLAATLPFAFDLFC